MLFLALLASFTLISNSQTNTLPTTGKVGIGTTSPATHLHILGNMTLEAINTSNSAIFTGTGTLDLGRYLTIINSVQKTSASGLKAGGVLVADDYAYANPG